MIPTCCKEIITNISNSSPYSPFFIDPAEHNPRAKHVYENAGFKMVGDFEMDIGVFKGEQTHLMVKTLPKRIADD